MKPIVSTFVFSEDSQNINDPGNHVSAMHVVNPVNVLRPTFIPSNYSFSVTIGLLHVDPNTEHVFSFELIRSDTEETIVQTGGLNVPQNLEFDKKLPIEAASLMFNFGFRNVPFVYPGKYIGLIKHNDISLGEFPLFVFAKEMS